MISSRTAHLRAGALGVWLWAAVAIATADPYELNLPVVIEGATVIPAPGQKLENASVLIIDGRIRAIGQTLTVPAGARVIDGKGLHVYAGFIDGFSRAGVVETKPDASAERRYEGEFESRTEGPLVTMPAAGRHGFYPDRSVLDQIDSQSKDFASARSAGFTTALLAPSGAVLGGHTALISLADRPLRERVIRPMISQTASFSRPGARVIRARGSYPGTILGVISMLRQTLLDAQWYAETAGYAERHASDPVTLTFDPALDALLPVLNGELPLMFEADNADELDRIAALGAEFDLEPWPVGAAEAYKRIDALKQRRVPVIAQLNFSKEPRKFELKSAKLRKAADDRSLFGKAWEERPFDPAALHDELTRERSEQIANLEALDEAGIAWCISGGDKSDELLSNLHECVAAGLSAEAALRALTITPAELYDAADELGTVAVGRRAQLTILSAPLGDKDAKVRYVVIDGQVHEFTKDKKSAGGSKRPDRTGGRRGGRPDFDVEPEFHCDSLHGMATSFQTPPEEELTQDSEQSEDAPPADDSDEKSEDDAKDKKKKKEEEIPPGPHDVYLQHVPEWPIENDAARKPSFQTGGDVLLENATVLTVTNGILKNTAVLVRDGRIAQIGQNLTAPGDVARVDLTGYFLMPGIIDPHAHIAIDGVNEFSGSVTPEVRILDVVNSRSRRIYDALTGGCTTIHAMHGSANTIGGQCGLLKMKFGVTAADMIVPDQRRTVKFATGENVKQSGGGNTIDGEDADNLTRFPKSRMGVEVTMRRALAAGREYGEQWRTYLDALEAEQDARPVRRDLRLEALAEIVSGDIWINMHCYRADEVLRALQVAEDFGVRMGALHHNLEGYRIAPEQVRHGMGSATFSDWWAYKYEAYDAVPQNAGLLLKAGLNSTIKSDSADLMRHMNLEAAKCMQFSNLTSDEAIELITIRPARLFGLESRIGSIEVGKEADLAVFDGHPLDTFAKCVATFIEGEVYFTHRDFNVTNDDRATRPALTFWQDQLPERAGAAWTNDGSGRLPQNLKELQPLVGDRETGPAGRYALVGATVHPVSGDPIEDGAVLIDGDEIVAVGHALQIPADARVVNAEGLHIYPGIVNAATQLGLQEVEAYERVIDSSEVGRFQPDIHALTAFNPHSRMIEVTRGVGILTSLILPDGPYVAGQAGLVHIDGWTMAEMRAEDGVALIVEVPSFPAKPAIPREEEPTFVKRQRERAGKLQGEIRDFFESAQRYEAARAADENFPIDGRYEAMRPYIRGEKPVLFEADGYKQIIEALMVAEQFKLRPVILGGREAWKAATLLAEKKVPVIYEGVMSMPGRNDAWDCNYAAAAVMAKAGVKFCFAHRGADLAKLLPVEAGFAVAHGLDEDAALRAITQTPAEILGIADQLGTLEAGKLANVIVTTGHPCQAGTRVIHAFVRGRPVSLESDHTRQAARFADRPVPTLPPIPEPMNGSASQSGWNPATQAP